MCLSNSEVKPSYDSPLRKSRVIFKAFFWKRVTDFACKQTPDQMKPVWKWAQNAQTERAKRVRGDKNVVSVWRIFILLADVSVWNRSYWRMIYWLYVPHFVWWLKLKKMDCSSESIQFDVRRMTDALISVFFIAGLLMVFCLCAALKATQLYYIASVWWAVTHVHNQSHQHFFPIVSLPSPH